MCKHLFVCGTLRPAIVRGEFQSLIASLKQIGRGTTRGRLYDLGDYPGGVLDPDVETAVVGDLLELPDDDAVLATLDEYEGYFVDDLGRSLFVRRRCPVRLDDGREMESWMYVYNGDVSSAILIPKGDYLLYKQER